MKKFIVSLLSALVILLCVGCSNSNNSNELSKEKPGEEIQLSNAVNVRDLGGYETIDGRFVQSHRLIRGAQLYALSTEDQSKLLNQYGLKKIIDFRTDSEVKNNPDPIINYVSYTHVPIMKDTGNSTSTTDFIAHLKELQRPENYLIEANKNFVNEDFSRKGYKEFFNILLENTEGATLWHCTAGKDRAGFGSALVLLALGVPEEVVVKDYLLSNKYRAEENEKAIQKIADTFPGDIQAVESMKALMEVREEYIQAGFDEIKAQYGNFNNFFTEGLGLNKNQIEKLKQMYLTN